MADPGLPLRRLLAAGVCRLLAAAARGDEGGVAGAGEAVLEGAGGRAHVAARLTELRGCLLRRKLHRSASGEELLEEVGAVLEALRVLPQGFGV
jgi:hypothetical protein